MELNRDAAKSAIVGREKTDPELDEALKSASDLQLGLVKEQNRHAERMRGLFSRIFGHDDNVPSYIAAFAMLIGLVAFVSCLVAAGRVQESATAFWAQQAERALGFSASCLAFIFGKGISK